MTMMTYGMNSKEKKKGKVVYLFFLNLIAFSKERQIVNVKTALNYGNNTNNNNNTQS